MRRTVSVKMAEI